MKPFAHPRVIERGILTSAYKQEIRENVRYMKSKSISQIKLSLLSSHEKLTSQTGVILKVSLCAIVIVSILL